MKEKNKAGSSRPETQPRPGWALGGLTRPCWQGSRPLPDRLPPWCWGPGWVGAGQGPAGRGTRPQTGSGLPAGPTLSGRRPVRRVPPVESAFPRCGPRWGAAAFETPVLPGQGWAGAGPVLAWEINPGFPNPACTEQFQSP